MLQSKLFIPPVRSDHIRRGRLFELLDQGLEKALVLISAPAGYGKTSLVTAWLHEKEIQSAWLSIDEGDNDPMRFMRGLLAVLEVFLPAAVPELRGVLEGGRPPDVPALMRRLVNELASIQASFCLVFDDYHLIHAPAVEKAVQFLAESRLPAVHVFLLSRIDPALPLARLRASRLLTEVRAEQLRFTPAEARAFFSLNHALTLSPDDLAALQERTEGWAAGLQLAVLSLQGCQDAHAFISSFSGSHHYIMDYLAEEVLRELPRKSRTFLLQTSILERLCPDLCEEVVIHDALTPVAARQTLEAFDRQNLFLIPLDNQQEWRRYHHLFADVLRHNLQQHSPQLVPELHLRASQWYERNGFFTDAVQHALQAGDMERAASLLEKNGCFVLISGEVATFLKWMETLSVDLAAHPWLAIQKAWALAMSGRLDEAEECMAAPERALALCERSIEVDAMLGTIAAARAFCANARQNTRAAVACARQALARLPDCDALSRSIRSAATSILGDAAWFNGELDEAAKAYGDAMRIGREAGNLNMVIIAGGNLAEVLTEQGHLQRACEIYRDCLSAALRPDGQPSPLAGRLYGGMGELFYEFNRLEEADQNVRTCLDISLKGGDSAEQAGAWLMLGGLELARGRAAESLRAARAADQALRQCILTPRAEHMLKVRLARLWLCQGQVEKAAQFIQKNHLAAGGEITYDCEPDYLLLLRLRLAEGSFDSAVKLSERLLRQVESEGCVHRLIELLTLQALIFQGKKDTERGLAVLEKALALAEPEGFRRIFLDEKEPLMKLMYQLHARQPGNTLAAELIDSFGRTPRPAGPESQALFEPLTSRELEVLGMIAAGSANQEIAEKLVISLPTVKRHISNIYTKLGVSSRTQAVSIGRELKLIG